MTEGVVPVWLVTGCSAGLGHALGRAVLSRGWRLAAAARDPGRLVDLVDRHGDDALALKLDVTDPSQVRAAIGECVRRFGRLDVLVNSAGHGYAASIEEGRAEEVRALFETNVFGLAEMTRQALPIMRAQRSGWIVNMSSMGGIVGNPGTGYYAASKFAVEGLSDALAKEVEPLGIRVLVVEPGPFRTGFRDTMRREPSAIADYEGTVGARLRGALSAPQPGDPDRAAEAIIAALESKKPPTRLLLGRIALRNAREKLAAMSADFDAWEQVTLAADFPELR